MPNFKNSDQLKKSNSKKNGKNSDIYLAGIGASAGGLDALNRFFSNVPEHTGIAYVVVQHLSPNHESHMASLLSKKTNMDVYQIRDGMEIEPNTVYLIPPNNNIKIHKNKLYLDEPEEKDRRYLNLPIDIFLKSLAQARGKKAVAVILSGTGSDGVRGIRAIKEKNGMVMVQSKDSAKFDGMPSNAAATGIVDYILPPEKMGKRLLNYVHHPYLNSRKTSVVDKSDSEDENFFTKILSLIREKTGIDFFQYKENTVIRRIERRMIINQIERLKNYYKYLKQANNELDILSRELLIGVTNFFRDEEAFSILKEEVIPELLRKKGSNEEIRVWAAGCSTGEEVYSLAILFMEYLEKHRGNNSVKIFATDIQAEVLKKASIGKYPGSIVADVSTKRLSRFFVKEGNMYKINKSIRDMVIFSRHNLIKDPPFHKIDLISCRNLLIYLRPGIQQKVISNFRFSLNNNGYLFLGSSESLGDMFNNFSVINSKWNVFQCKKCGSELNAFSNDSFNNVHISSDNESLAIDSSFTSRKRSKKKQLSEKIHEELLKNQVSDTVVIDQNNQLVDLVGDINEYFNFPENKVSLNIIDMCPKGLDQALSVAVNKVKRDKDEVVYKGVEFRKDGKSRSIDLYLTVLNIDDLKRELISVRFIKNSLLDNSEEKKSSIIEYNEDEHAKQRIKDLEQELEYTRENLQATIEELETSNEELQATNEELMASNQQLQSTNEELESVNEELLTVNSEHQQKIEELTRLNNDIDNLLKSTNIGVVFLDNQLQIRKFTPVAQKIINLRDRDIGRPLKDISTDIEYDDLYEKTKYVRNKGITVEEKIRSSLNDWYLMKIIPYETRENKTSGVVITFIDINQLHQSNKELQKLSYAVEESPFITVITDKNAVISYVNNTFEEITGYKEQEVLGEGADIVKSGRHGAEFYKNLWDTIKRGESWQGEFINKNKEGTIFREKAYIFPLLDKDNIMTHYIKFSILPEQIN